MAAPHREEPLNTVLAQIMCEHGVQAEAETILRLGKARPDITIRMEGITICVEAKSDYFPKADLEVVKNAQDRLDNELCTIAIAVLYPKDLRLVGTGSVKDEMSNTGLRYKVLVSGASGGNAKWFTGTPSSIVDVLRHTYKQLLDEDVVEKSAKEISNTISNIAYLWEGSEKVCEILSDTLKLFKSTNESPVERKERLNSAAKIASLMLANAMIFLAPKKPSHIKKCEDYFNSNASTLLLVERLGPISHRMVAVRTDTRVLGSTFRTLITNEHVEDNGNSLGLCIENEERPHMSAEKEKALALWFNSTPGLLILHSLKISTGPQWFKFKTYQMETMPVLDVHSLEPSAICRLSDCYDSVCTKDFLPVAKLYSDAARIEIDKCLEDVIGLPDLTYMRYMLSNEKFFSQTERRRIRTTVAGVDETREPDDCQMSLF